MDAGQVNVKMGLDADKFRSDIEQAEKGLNNLGKTGVKSLAKLQKYLTAGAIIYGLKQLGDGIMKSVEAFRIQDIAIKQLNNALANAGLYTDEYSQHLQELASSIQGYSNYGDEAILKSIALGQAMAGNTKFTDEAIKSIVDFAAAMNMDLDSAFRLVGKSVGSSTNALARYGIQLDKGMTAEQKMSVITETLGKKYSDSAKKMSNASVQLSNAIGDLLEVWGSLFNPVVEKSQVKLKEWVTTASSVLNKIKKIRIAYLEFERDSAKKYAGVSLFGAQKEFYNKEASKYQKEIDLLKSKIKGNEIVNNPNPSTYIPAKEKEKKAKESKENPAITEYKRFVEQYRQLTLDYDAEVKARQKVDSMDLVDYGLTQQDYQRNLQVYENYYKRINEIATSSAANKGSLLKLAENQLQKELAEITLEKQRESIKAAFEIRRSYEIESEKILQTKQARDELGGFMGSFQTGYAEKLSLLQWYYSERTRIANTYYSDMSAKRDAFNQLDQLKAQKESENEIIIWQQRGQDVKNIFSSTFSSMLTNYGSFSDNMKQMTLNLSNYILGQLAQMAWKAILTTKTMQSISGGFRSGGFGGMFNVIGGLFKHHSGGMILNKYHTGGLNQTEQLAILKNNERVLSPSETSAYNSKDGQSGSPNYIVYAPQVRAMDSRDVASWFNDNKNQIIGIVSQGIKNNSQGIRSQVKAV